MTEPLPLQPLIGETPPQEPLPDENNHLAPLNIIRTETVLSKLPIHNLAKKGSVNIRIIRKNDRGEVELLWKVSPSRDYGEPRQLAYKLDTIVINRRIEEQGRPLPQLIRLGTLNQLNKDLGSEKNEIKNAFLQNAFAGITAKLTYKAKDGTQRHLEAGFTRYSVVFTGERLPDGRQADAVYLILNDPYREVLNNAPARPLDYDYLKQLTPAPQRFYEIISYRIFAALTHRRTEAKLSYSGFCTYSALTRHLDYENFRVQMAKIHRPHLNSGYITAVRYQATTDAEGKPDWLMYYTPGPKARAEYRTFTRKPQVIETTATDPAQPKQGIAPTSAARPHNSPIQPAPQLDPQLLSELTKRGITEAGARRELSNRTPDQQALLADQLEWADYLIQQAPNGKIRNAPGLYIHLIEQNVTPPENFETTRRRQLREQAQQAQEAKLRQQARLELAYDAYRKEQIDRYLESLTPEQRQQFIEQKKTTPELKKLSFLKPDDLARMAELAVRSDIAKALPLLTLDDFRRQYATSQPPTPPT